jgi:hypothetical protein
MPVPMNCQCKDNRPACRFERHAGTQISTAPLEGADVTQPQNISSPVSASTAHLRVCEGVGQGRHALAQTFAKSTLSPELVVVVTQPKPRRRKPSLARLLAKAKQLGVDVTIEPTGTVTFRTGSSASAAVDSPQNEVDEWIAKRAH